MKNMKRGAERGEIGGMSVGRVCLLCDVEE